MGKVYKLTDEKGGTCEGELEAGVTDEGLWIARERVWATAEEAWERLGEALRRLLEAERAYAKAKATREVALKEEKESRL